MQAGGMDGVVGGKQEKESDYRYMAEGTNEGNPSARPIDDAPVDHNSNGSGSRRDGPHTACGCAIASRLPVSLAGHLAGRQLGKQAAC